MNGAQALIRTLVAGGVDTCFANPGTSELQFVAALDDVFDDVFDDVPQLHAVLGLFEGVVTGAADGYGRMAGRPAVTLLHLGPGLANGLANLHNARRAHTPVVAVVGEHATGHQRYDAPLQSDIAALAGTLEGWVRRCDPGGAGPGADAAEAVAAAMGPPGRVATLILPADVSWTDGAEPAHPIPPTAPRTVPEGTVEEVAAVLSSGEPTVLLLGGAATRRDGLLAAAGIAAATGTVPLCETFPARLERGGPLPDFQRLAYLPERVQPQLAGTRHLVLAGARSPVSFFGHPGQPGDLVPEDCTVHELAGPGDDVVAALAALAERVGADSAAAAGSSTDRDLAGGGELPTGPLDLRSMGVALRALLPAGAIVSDEAVTASAVLAAATERAAPHDWLSITGGAIGQGLPVATGAAVACRDRPVVSLQADGSAMYTISALWTQAREGLDVTTVILNNRSYAILAMELQRAGTTAPGPAARNLLDLSRPELDFTALAAGMGVPASRPASAEEFGTAFARALAEPGPHLIEVML